MKKYLYSLNEKITAETCGGKAANLSWLARNGYRIPEGFCISADFFRQIIRKNKIRPLIDELESHLKQGSSSEKLLLKIRKKILEIEFPAEIRDMVRKKLQGLECGYLAVRSSAISEDGAQDSFAGIFDSRLNVQNSPEAVAAALLEIWSSLFSDRVVNYLCQKKIFGFQFAAGVIVQEMIQAERAGVAFNLHPLQNDPDYIYVEETSSPGDKLVSGEVIPGIDVIRKQAVSSSVISQNKNFLLAGKILELEKKFAPFVDIEWAMENEKLYLLQIRPETTFQTKKVTVWTDENVGEVLPEVVTPLSWSILGGMTNASFSWVLKRSGLVTRNPGRLFRLIHGKAYFNHTMFNEAVFGTFLSGYHQNEGKVRRFRRTGKLLIRLFRFLYRFGILLFYLPFESRKIAAGSLKETMNTHLSAGRLSEELRAFQEKEQKIMKFHVANTFIGEIIFQIINAWIIRYFPETAKESAVEYVSRATNIRSAESGMALQKTAFEIKEYLNKHRIQIGKADDFLRLTETDEFVKSRLTGFLSRFGYMSDQEFELSHPRWQEDPKTLKVLIFNTIRQREFSSAGDGISRQVPNGYPGLNPGSGIVLTGMIKLLKIFSRNRENLKQQFIRYHFELKKRLLNAGHILCNRSVLKNPADIYFLRMGEIRRFLGSSAEQDSAAIISMVQNRKRSYGQQKKRSHPFRYIETEGHFSAPDYSRQKSPGGLGGIGSSPGYVEGRVRVVRDFPDGVYLQRGEILVTHSANPGWTPLFVMSAGIVTEIGGALSHAAIIAREYQKPMITSVENACAVLKTGDFIRLDGGSGEIKLLKKINGEAIDVEKSTVICK